MKTFQANSGTVHRKWHLLNADGLILGRLASQVARTIQGKGKTYYTPHVDCGDYVVVINAEKIRITGANKPTEKIDFRHSGYPGGHTMTPYKEFLKTNPERAILLAVKGMLPKTRLRDGQLNRLKVFKGGQHAHLAQFAEPKNKTQEKQESKA